MNHKFVSILSLVSLAVGQVLASSTCSCSLVSVVKSPIAPTTLLVDLHLPKIHSSSAITALHDCEAACRHAQADYLQLQSLNEVSLRPDISQSKPSADKVCTLLRKSASNRNNSDNRSVLADMYIHISHGATEGFRKSVPLGRVCCDRSLCGCELRKQGISDELSHGFRVDRELGPFECGTEKIHCDRECGEKVSGLLGIEVNSGFQATSLGDRICELEDRRMIRP